MSVKSPARTLTTRPTNKPRDDASRNDDWRVPPPPVNPRHAAGGWGPQRLALIPCQYTHRVLGAFGPYYVPQPRGRAHPIHTDPFDPWFRRSTSDSHYSNHPHLTPGSTELDTVTGCDSQLTRQEWNLFTQYVLGEHDYDISPTCTTITNILWGIIWLCANTKCKIDNHCLDPLDLFWLSVNLKRFNLILIGTLALSPYIWDTVFFDFFHSASSSRAFRFATCLQITGQNMMHAMLNDKQLNANGRPPIDQDLLDCLPDTHRRIIELLRNTSRVTYPREPAKSGEEAVRILMQNFMGEGVTFEELCVRWYNEGLVECHRSDEMGLTNGILRAYGYVKSGDTVESINTPPQST